MKTTVTITLLSLVLGCGASAVDEYTEHQQSGEVGFLTIDDPDDDTIDIWAWQAAQDHWLWPEESSAEPRITIRTIRPPNFSSGEYEYFPLGPPSSHRITISNASVEVVATSPEWVLSVR